MDAFPFSAALETKGALNTLQLYPRLFFLACSLIGTKLQPSFYVHLAWECHLVTPISYDEECVVSYSEAFGTS